MKFVIALVLTIPMYGLSLLILLFYMRPGHIPRYHKWQIAMCTEAQVKKV